MIKKIGTLMVAVSALAVASNANAFEYKPYAGVDYTYSRTNTRGTGGDYRPDHHGGAINVGTMFNQYFGTEAYYQLTGKDNKTVEDGDKLKTHYQSYGLDMMGYLPLYGCEGELSLVATAGIGLYDLKYKWSGESKQTDHGLGYRFGGGLQYSFNENLAVRGLVRHVEFNKIKGYDHMLEYSAGVRYSF